MTNLHHQPAVLYHYTCSHAAYLIRRHKTLYPGRYLGVNKKKLAKYSAQELSVMDGVRSFVWMTDLAPPAPRGPLGLTSQSLACDRTQFVFEVEPDWDHARWWMYVRREHPDLLALECEPDAMPVHWFVSEEPVPIYAELDRTGEKRWLANPR
jgi:hypothetical protein